MTLTPGQIARRADFYFQVASLIAAGVPIIQVLEMMEKSSPRSYGKHLEMVVANLNKGSTFTKAIA